MKKPISVVPMDPIAQRNKKNPGVISRLLKTRHFRGKGMARTDAFGHYMFCGRQRSGKSVSFLWFYEYLKTYYEKKGKMVITLDNLGISKNPIYRNTLPYVFDKLQYDKDVVYFILVDEIQSWYSKEDKSMETNKLVCDLASQMDQLGKRQIYLLSTAQVYGKLNKLLREQCLFMVHCRRSYISNKVVNEFIDGDDILCDDLGRWSGYPTKIYVHGLPKTRFDTHRLISSRSGPMLQAIDSS